MRINDTQKHGKYSYFSLCDHIIRHFISLQLLISKLFLILIDWDDEIKYVMIAKIIVRLENNLFLHIRYQRIMYKVLFAF